MITTKQALALKVGDCVNVARSEGVFSVLSVADQGKGKYLVRIKGEAWEGDQETFFTQDQADLISLAPAATPTSDPAPSDPAKG